MSTQNAEQNPSVPPRSFTSRVEELRAEAIEAAARALAADAGLDLDDLAKDADPGDTAADLAAWRSNWIESGTVAADAVLPIVSRAIAEEIARRCTLYRDFFLAEDPQDRHGRAEIWDSARQLAEEYLP